jgi:hypothetical protein
MRPATIRADDPAGGEVDGTASTGCVEVAGGESGAISAAVRLVPSATAAETRADFILAHAVKALTPRTKKMAKAGTLGRATNVVEAILAYSPAYVPENIKNLLFIFPTSLSPLLFGETKMILVQLRWDLIRRLWASDQVLTNGPILLRAT